MYCTNCGNPLMENALFCDRCGANVEIISSSSLMEGDAKRMNTGSRSVMGPPLATRPLARTYLSLPNGIEVDLQVGKRILIGRTDGKEKVDLDLSPVDPELYSSRKHAEINVMMDVFSLRDLGSRNGTYVNGKKLVPFKDVVLKDGDALLFGKVSCTFRRAT